MKLKRIVAVTVLAVLLVVSGSAFATSFDPYLHQKAQDYTDWLMQWHSTGLGGVSDVLFTDDARTDLLRTWGAGDSTDWTATYLVAMAARYAITGEQQARDEVIRIAEYLHLVQDITGDPGYLARYAGPNQAPWNGEYNPCLVAHGCYEGEGDYVGDFWVGHQSRDKYMHWYWALTWAHLTVDDAPMRATIEADMVQVLETLIANNWTIVDPWGDTYSASEIGPDLQLSFILQTATVTGDPYWWDQLNLKYDEVKYQLWITTIAFFNQYFDYYAFINSQAVMQPIFSLWPDRERLQHLYDIWMFNNRQHTANTHQTFFDAVYYGACMRLGNCSAVDLDYYKYDAFKGLTDMNEAPNYQRAVTCPTIPLDPFSVWADQFLAQIPWIEDFFDIDPQTDEAHEIADRCWVSVLWERNPHHIECTKPDMPAHVTHGSDYLIAYWLGIYWGMLPGDGPYGDDDLDEPDDDDDNDDNDTTDDDDDTVDDDDDTVDDDDSAGDDDEGPGADDDDDNDDNNDDGGCCG
jgi:hypothetical protein